MRHSPDLTPILLIFLALTLCGCKPEETPVPPETPKVSVMQPVVRELTDQEEFNGWMEADQIVEVRARVRGHIQKVAFKDGQFVKQGDLLFELDPRPFEQEIGRVSDTRKVLEAQLVAAEKEEARLKTLLDKGGASLQQVEKAEADRLALEAQISSMQNEIDRAKLELEYSKIAADIGGRVGRAELTEGNLVNAGGSDPLLTTIVSSNPIRVYFNIDERSLLRYAKSIGSKGGSLNDLLASLKDRDAKFHFALDGETEFSHEGSLKFGDNRVDPTTGTMQLYGTVSNADGSFVPGSRVRVRLRIGEPYSAMLVPDTAILSDQDKRYVLIVDDKKTVRRRNVTLGSIADDGFRSILPAEKLAKDENVADWKVIVDNLQRARLNYPVDAQPADTSVSLRDSQTLSKSPLVVTSSGLGEK